MHPLRGWRYRLFRAALMLSILRWRRTAAAAPPGRTSRPSGGLPVGPRTAAVLGVLGLGLLWAYWTTLARMGQRWSNDPQYSHGFLVPLFALAVLWFRRDRFPTGILSPSWWGVPLLLAGVA